MKFFIILFLLTINLTFSQSTNKLNVLIASGKYNQAIQLLTEMIKFNPNDEVLFSKRGVLYERINDYNSAISDFDKAIQLNDKDDKLFFVRGKILEKQNKDSLAIVDFQKAISIKNHSDYYFYKGVSEHKLGRKQQACGDWNTSSKIAEMNKYPKFHECQVNQLFIDKSFTGNKIKAENVDSLIVNKETKNTQKSSSQEIKEYFERIKKNKELKKLEELNKHGIESTIDSIQVHAGEKFEELKSNLIIEITEKQIDEPKTENMNQSGTSINTELSKKNEVINQIEETRKQSEYIYKENKAVQTDFPERKNKQKSSAVKDFYKEGFYKKSKK